MRAVLTVCVCSGVPNSVDQLIIAVEVSSVLLQVLRRSSRIVDRKACKFNISRAVVDQTQVSKASPGMLPVNCIDSSALTDGQVSIEGFNFVFDDEGNRVGDWHLQGLVYPV